LDRPIGSLGHIGTPNNYLNTISAVLEILIQMKHEKR